MMQLQRDLSDQALIRAIMTLALDQRCVAPCALTWSGWIRTAANLGPSLVDHCFGRLEPTPDATVGCDRGADPERNGHVYLPELDGLKSQTVTAPLKNFLRTVEGEPSKA